MCFLRSRTFRLLVASALTAGGTLLLSAGELRGDPFAEEHERALAPFSSTASGRLGRIPAQLALTQPMPHAPAPVGPASAEPAGTAWSGALVSLRFARLGDAVPHLTATGFVPTSDAVPFRDHDATWAKRDGVPAQSLFLDGRDPVRDAEAAELAAEALPASRRHPVLERIAAIPEPTTVGTWLGVAAFAALALRTRRSVKDC